MSNLDSEGSDDHDLQGATWSHQLRRKSGSGVAMHVISDTAVRNNFYCSHKSSFKPKITHVHAINEAK